MKLNLSPEQEKAAEDALHILGAADLACVIIVGPNGGSGVGVLSNMLVEDVHSVLRAALNRTRAEPILVPQATRQ